MSQKGNETRKMILEAAGGLFAAKGFKDVSMSDICERTGLSRGGLYRHYASPSQIFKEIITKEYTFDEEINRGERAEEILKRTLTLVEREIVQKQNSLSLAIYEYANTGENKEQFLEIESKAKNRWVKLIEYGISTGEFNRVDAEAVAELILYYYQGLRMWSRVVNIDKKAAENYKQNILQMLMKKDCEEKK